MARRGHRRPENSNEVINAFELMTFEGDKEDTSHVMWNSELLFQEGLRASREEYLRECERRAASGGHEEDLRSLVRALSERVERLEERLSAQGRVLTSSEGRGGVRREEHERLEARMRQLEASLKATMDRVLPRVEALLGQLEERSSPVPSASPFSAPSPTVRSFSSFASASSCRDVNNPSRRLTSETSTSPSRFCPCCAPSLGVDRDLVNAVEMRQLETARAFLDRGANINFHFWDGLTPLHVATSNGDADMVHLLLERGANVNAAMRNGSTALHCASSLARLGRSVELLLVAGAEVNSKDIEGKTPLHWAAFEGQRASVSALIAAGAHVDAVDNEGLTALHWAAHWGNASVVRALIDAGADVKRQSNMGATPLHCAARYHENGDAIRALVAAGAPKTVKNKHGQTAYDMAALWSKRSAELRRFLFP